MYTCATMAYSIQLQNTLTEICGVQKQQKSMQTSNKKHFMKNVKECRDVSVKKVLEHSYYTLHTCWTYDTLHRCLILYVV